MPITKSAEKALRQAKTRQAQNIAKKDAYKKLLKEYRKLVSEKKTEEAKAKLSKLQKALDKAGKTGAITKNKASRLKGRASHALK
jgi:small subunit ribosomal protein S20